MSPLTSIAGSVLVCAFVGALANQHYSWITLGCAAAGAQLPHWFERPWLTQRFGPHTLTHSLLGLTIVGLFLSPLLCTRHSSLFTVFLIGYATHLLLDAATERGVWLFYPSRARAVLPRHPLSRIVPGSPRERRLRWWLLGLWLVALPLNAIGLRGLLHRLIPVAQFAVEDYLTVSRQGRRVFVDFTGRFTDSQRLISGRWEVLEAFSRTSLLLEDPQGTRYVLGTHPHDTIQAFTVRARKGPPLDVRLHVVHLQAQALGDLVPLIPPDGRTYLIGVMSTPEDVPPSFAVDQFQPIRIGHAQVELRYATLRDLQEAHLGGLYVTEGEVLLRTLLEPARRPSARAEAPLRSAALVRSEAPQRTISLTVRRLHDPQELLVHPEQTVARGQPLADLRSSRSALFLKQRVAQAKSRAAHALVERLQLAHQQTLALKRTEDALAGIHRDLAGLQAQQTQELAQAQAQVEAATAQLDALAHALAATIIRSPVAGRILSVRLQHEAAFLRILADD